MFACQVNTDRERQLRHSLLLAHNQSTETPRLVFKANFLIIIKLNTVRGTDKFKD